MDGSGTGSGQIRQPWRKKKLPGKQPIREGKRKDMPTERFMKLKDEKKKRILDAAFREFSRVPFREASINQIIKDAEISRGSFYTYFEDKTDLLQILLRDGTRNLTDRLYRDLEASGGDYFRALDETFLWFREKLAEEDNMAVSFLRNTLSNEEIFRDATGLGEARVGDDPTCHPFYKDFKRFCEEITEKLDRTRYPITPEQMAVLFPMTIMIIVKTAADCAEYPTQEPIIRKQLEILLDIIKNGVYRREERPAV